MEYISRVLFGIANSLLIPDVILLILFFIRALILLGGTYNGFMARRRNSRLFDPVIKELTPQGIGRLRAMVAAPTAAASGSEQAGKAVPSLFTQYLADLLEHAPSEDYADFLITNFETEAAKEINLSRLLAKLGPVLGLIGTLISMSPALVGLSTGDIGGMAYNMQVVFAATVVGLIISAVGLFTLQLKQRWYAKDANQLDYVSRILNAKP